MFTAATSNLRVVVVGGGIAGLAAAHILQGHGIAAPVLEASGRVGGRMISEAMGGHVVDCGAQFLSADYPVIHRLLGDVGMLQHVRRASGYSATVRAGRARVMRSGRAVDALTSGLLSLPAWLRLGWSLFRMSATLRRRSLSDYSQWAGFDTENASAWAGRELGAEVHDRVYEPMLGGFYFQAPEETSRALALVLTAFGLRRAPILSLDGGLGGLPQALARGLDVRLDTRVNAVEIRGPGVRIATSSGCCLDADRTILAVPAPAARRIMVDSADDPTDRLLATPYSASINVACTTDAGFMLPGRLASVYGLLIPRCERLGVAAVGIENNKRPGLPREGHLLNLLLSHASAVRLLSSPDADIIAHAVGALGGLQPELAEHLTGARVYRWPWAEPCSPVGRAAALRLYRRRCAQAPPRVILAGDYMSMPYTEGAAESGLWAANLIASTVSG